MSRIIIRIIAVILWTIYLGVLLHEFFSGKTPRWVDAFVPSIMVEITAIILFLQVYNFGGKK